MKTIGYLALSLFCLPLSAVAGKDFERMDGQNYNGQFYPMVDIIEWGEQNKENPHMELHLHSKEKPMDVAVVSGEKGGRPVLWIMYDLKFRGGEKICRHVLAPAQFKEGQKLYTYRDNTDADYDNVLIYSEPMKQAKGKKAPIPDYSMPSYERCSDENASNMPYPKGQEPVKAAEAAPAPARDPATNVAPTPSAPKQGKGIPIDYDNTAVPFSF